MPVVSERARPMTAMSADTLEGHVEVRICEASIVLLVIFNVAFAI